jgi:hypothetical protein
MESTNVVSLQALLLNEGLADDVDAEAEEVLNELNLLTETEDAGSDIHSQGDPADWGRYLDCITMCQGERKQLQ